MGDKVRLYTDVPGDLLCHIMDYARSNGLRIVTLSVLAPILENVFVRLTEGHGV